MAGSRLSALWQCHFTRVVGRQCKRLVDLINQKRAGKIIAHKPRPRGENVLDLMDALKRSISAETRREKRARLRVD
jgi:non-homologous end joining protein Ku